jgi:hypothetical protein
VQIPIVGHKTRSVILNAEHEGSPTNTWTIGDPSFASLRQDDKRVSKEAWSDNQEPHPVSLVVLDTASVAAQTLGLRSFLGRAATVVTPATNVKEGIRAAVRGRHARG